MTEPMARIDASADGALVALNVAFPAVLEEDVIDFCHERAALMPGFTLLQAEGFGAAQELRTASEAVMGRARRRVLLAIVREAQARAVLADLRRELPSHDIVYWMTPVIEIGRLA
jgi:hypothetical protein